MKKLIIIFFALISATALASEEGLPLIGLDKNGAPVQMFVSKKVYQKKMAQMVVAVNDSTLPVMAKHSEKHQWSIRTVLIGITLDLEAGFTPIFKLGFLPRFRILFSNSRDPVYP